MSVQPSRAELAAATLALLADNSAAVATGGQAFLDKGQNIIQQHMERRRADLFEDDGTMILGGRESPLHRVEPWPRRWALTKDGDMWKAFSAAVQQKGPHTVALMKVTGHATLEMATAGDVPFEDYDGKVEADRAADRGANWDEMLASLVDLYAEKARKVQTPHGDAHQVPVGDAA